MSKDVESAHVFCTSHSKETNLLLPKGFWSGREEKEQLESGIKGRIFYHEWQALPKI